MNTIRKLLTGTATTAALAVALAACSADAESDTANTGAATTPSAAVPSAPGADGQTTAITLTIAGRSINATLNDSAVSQDLVDMLPVTLPWFRNGSIEYITELESPLTETGPFYTDVEPGDLVYWNPADSLTIIYEPTSSVPTLTKMGEITSDLSVFRGLPDNIDVTIERV